MQTDTQYVYKSPPLQGLDLGDLKAELFRLEAELERERETAKTSITALQDTVDELRRQLHGKSPFVTPPSRGGKALRLSMFLPPQPEVQLGVAAPIEGWHMAQLSPSRPKRNFEKQLEEAAQALVSGIVKGAVSTASAKLRDPCAQHQAVSTTEYLTTSDHTASTTAGVAPQLVAYQGQMMTELRSTLGQKVSEQQSISVGHQATYSSHHEVTTDSPEDRSQLTATLKVEPVAHSTEPTIEEPNTELQERFTEAILEIQVIVVNYWPFTHLTAGLEGCQCAPCR